MTNSHPVPPNETAELPEPTVGGRQKLIDFARRALMVLVFAAAAYFIVVNWPQVQETVFSLHWWQLVLSLLALIPGVLLGMMMWRVVMVGILRSRHLSPEGKSLNQIYLVGQIGKYLPGSVWAFVLQMELGRKNGLARAQVFVASLISTGVTVGASLVVGAMALPLIITQQPSLQWLYIVLPFVLLAMNPHIVTFLVNVVLKALRRPPLPERIRASTMLQAFGLGVAMYCFFGLHLWILVGHETALTIGNLMLLTGALSLGMTAGVLAFLLPAGVGAREFVLYLALAGLMTAGAATAIAALSRIMFTVADLLCVGVAFIHLRKTAKAEKANRITKDD
ncbi:flippase-like domain-containing protein [Pseudarthrobacter sp. RMG13]|uniref:Flippase-like domain-containing protein n=1 Tax=Pseudarthrobacter humi TaxID=2952523 RepID=A0ABT1LJT6_9MICC|nr:flippase-like domain-containing protein [Pseudarthrobacter humi]MCP8998667.1 flippase-like domain-containing protein [Pseudarthrobacter humi]